MSEESIGEYVGGENEPEYVPSPGLAAVLEEAGRVFEDTPVSEIMDRGEQLPEGDLTWLRTGDWDLDPQADPLPFNGEAFEMSNGESEVLGDEQPGEYPPDESQLIDL